MENPLGMENPLDTVIRGWREVGMLSDRLLAELDLDDPRCKDVEMIRRNAADLISSLDEQLYG